MNAYDAVVVGAGHNGLVCAAYLAKAGLSVVVVERTDRIGGACVTEELFPGFRISTASYSLSLMLPEVMQELGLELDIRPKDPAAFHPLDDGGGVFLWSDRSKAAESIANVSRRDAEAYGRFEDLFDEAARRLRPLLAYPATRKQARRAFRASDVEGLFAKTVDGSIAELCEEYFETDVMQGLMASQGIIGTAAGPRTPGTSYIYLHHAFGEAAGRSGAWGFVRGGMGAITAALADVVREHGGEIRLESPVSSVKFADRKRASGVVLESGEEIDAPVVCSNAHTLRTLVMVRTDCLTCEFM